MQYARVNVLPRSTRRSMCGVRISALPSAPTASGRWSSLNRKSTLRGASCAKEAKQTWMMKRTAKQRIMRL